MLCSIVVLYFDKKCYIYQDLVFGSQNSVYDYGVVGVCQFYDYVYIYDYDFVYGVSCVIVFDDVVERVFCIVVMC